MRGRNVDQSARLICRMGDINEMRSHTRAAVRETSGVDLVRLMFLAPRSTCVQLFSICMTPKCVESGWCARSAEPNSNVASPFLSVPC